MAAWASCWRRRQSSKLPLCVGQSQQLLDELRVDDELARVDAPLVRQGGVGHRPTLALGAQAALGGHEDAVQLDLVELGLTGRLHERVHRHALGVHVHHERRDAELALRRVGIRAGQAQPPVGELRVGRPHLATRDAVAAVHRDGARGQRSQVAAGVGLAEELAPQLLGREDARQEALLLLGRAVGQQGRPHQVDADAADQLGCPGPCQLLDHDVVLERAEAAAAVLDGPGHADPAVGGQVGLPAPAERDRLGQVVEARRESHAVGPREVLDQPRPELLAQAFPARPWRADPCGAAWHSRP